jgi:DNA gyrase subunit A
LSTNINLIDELLPVSIEDEMKRSYLDYAMSVIIARAIPDARDGLKPVHRRILYSMHDNGLDYNKPHKKSGRVVGDVLGKYHPHGDQAIYDSLVRMAQNFSLRHELVDGQGNFGSIDGDAPAAMRYTEVRLKKISNTLLDDLDKNTVDFVENYDGSEMEPKVLPAKFPNLLVNGSGGIAVGMATNIPTHNLAEVIDSCCAAIDNPDITIEELCQYVQGPDFPTGGSILGRAGIRSALMTGRGSVIMRGKCHTETAKNGKESIIISEIPYQINKSKLVERIAELVKEKKIEGIADLRDESAKEEIRIVIELKKDAFPEVLIKQLYSYTPLQTSFGVNMLALDKGQPKLLNLKDFVDLFLEFREEVITKRTIYLLEKTRDRAHVLIGLSIAINNIDEVISIIRGSPDPVAARERLLAKKWRVGDVAGLIELVADHQNAVEGEVCYFTESQVKAILEMRLQRLTGLEKDKLVKELEDLALTIKDCLEILSSRARLLADLKAELISIKEEFGQPRRTIVEESEFEHDIEDLIPREEMVVTVTLGGYIKRVPLDTYRSQRRGGRGKSGIQLREDDVTTNIFITSTHTSLLFFSNFGKVYRMKVYKIPIATAQSKGRALVNLLPLAEGEIISQLMPMPEDKERFDQMNIVFTTDKGNVRRNKLSDFSSIHAGGKIAMKLDEDDSLVGVAACEDDDNLFLASRSGRAVRFPVSALRVFKSRDSDGVRGMRLDEGEKVMSLSVINKGEENVEIRDAYLNIPVAIRMSIAALENKEDMKSLLEEIGEISLTEDQIFDMAKNEQFILTITENGFGKRTSAYEYRITNRGGSGVFNIDTSVRNGQVVASMPISIDEQIIMITNKGTVIRCPVHDVRITSRNTQGVVLFKTSEGEKIVSIAKVKIEENEDEEEGEGVEETAEIINDEQENGNQE